MPWENDLLMEELKPVAKGYYLYNSEEYGSIVYRASTCNPVLHYIVDGIRELLGLPAYGVLRTTNVSKKILLLDTPHAMEEGKLVIKGHCLYTISHRTKERDEEMRRWLIYRELLNLVATPFLLVVREGEVIITAQPESIYSYETKKSLTFQTSDKNISTYFGNVQDFSRYAGKWVEEHVTDRFYDEVTEFIRSVDERMLWITGHIRQREAMLRGISPDEPSIPRTLGGDELLLPWMKEREVSTGSIRTSCPSWANPEQMKEKILAAG